MNRMRIVLLNIHWGNLGTDECYSYSSWTLDCIVVSNFLHQGLRVGILHRAGLGHRVSKSDNERDDLVAAVAPTHSGRPGTNGA